MLISSEKHLRHNFSQIFFICVKIYNTQIVKENIEAMSVFIWDVASRHWLLIFIDVSGQGSDSFFKSRMYNVIGRSNFEEGDSRQCRNVGYKSTSDEVQYPG